MKKILDYWLYRYLGIIYLNICDIIHVINLALYILFYDLNILLNNMSLLFPHTFKLCPPPIIY